MVFKRAPHARNQNGQCLDVMPLSGQGIGRRACVSLPTQKSCLAKGSSLREWRGGQAWGHTAYDRWM